MFNQKQQTSHDHRIGNSQARKLCVIYYILLRRLKRALTTQLIKNLSFSLGNNIRKHTSLKTFRFCSLPVSTSENVFSMYIIMKCRNKHF